MATKKPKRFDQGGLSDKEAGLEASKDDKVGFFERLRMGNIDEEGSEAYNRFGAGRGRAARVPVEDRVAAPVEKRVPIPVATAPMPTASTGTMRGEEDLAQGRMRTQKEMDEERGGAILEKMRDDANKTRVAKPSAPTKSNPTKTSAYPMTGTQPTTKTYERGSGKAPASSLASQIPSGSNTKPAVGEATEPMSDTERQIKNALAATGVGAGAAGLFYKGKKMLDARKAAQQGAKKRAELKRAAEEGIERNLADEFKDYSVSAAEKAVAAKQLAAKTKAERSRDLAAGQAKTKFTSTSKTPSKRTKKFDDNESNVEFKRGGSVSSASKRGDGIATRGKTNCKMR